MNLSNELFRTLSVPLQAFLRKCATKPFSVGISLTERCNSKCAMCDYWKKSGLELSFNQIEHILDQVSRLGVEVVNYSAHGEIFVNRNIKEILTHTRDLGFTLSLNTNALALADEQNALFLGNEIKPFLISIGLDTVNDEIYEKIRGISSGLSRVKKAIANLMQAGIHNITLGSVILDHNLDHLTSLVTFAETMHLSAVRFTAYQRFFQQSDYTWSRLSEKEYLSKLRLRIDELLHLQKSHSIMRNSSYYLKKIPDFYSSRHFFPVKCVVGYLRMDIMENGDVTLCPFLGKPIGNVFENKLSEIWFSEKANKVRQQMLEGHCPGCWLSCFAEENIRFTFKHGLNANWQALMRYRRMEKNTV